MPKLLLLSNSTMPGTPFFTWPVPYVREFLKDAIKEVLFIPFAAVTLGFEEYVSLVQDVFGSMGYKVRSLHSQNDPVQAVQNAEAIIVGGGNTFALLSRIYSAGVLEVIRMKLLLGTPYIGWSAGSNIAAPTIMTTNDMPVVQLPSLHALNVVPFQINPHYHEFKFEDQGGETRRERLQEFLILNPGKKVVGLPEGMMIHRDNQTLFLRGTGIAKWYIDVRTVKDLEPGDISFLLRDQV